MSPRRFAAPPAASKPRFGTRFLARSTAFTDSRNPQILPDLRDHAKAHVAEVVRLFAGEAPDDFAFVRAHARRRAEQRFPLEATLHAYRCGHRAISRWLRDAAAAARPQIAHRGDRRDRRFRHRIHQCHQRRDDVGLCRPHPPHRGRRRGSERRAPQYPARRLRRVRREDRAAPEIGRLPRSASVLLRRRGADADRRRARQSRARPATPGCSGQSLCADQHQDPRGPAQFAGGRGRIGVAPAVGLDGAANEPGRAPGFGFSCNSGPRSSPASAPIAPRRPRSPGP